MEAVRGWKWVFSGIAHSSLLSKSLMMLVTYSSQILNFDCSAYQNVMLVETKACCHFANAFLSRLELS